MRDRVARGRVVDFINIGIGPVRTGIFNVADVAIMLGVGVVILAELRRDKDAQSPPRRGITCNEAGRPKCDGCNVIARRQRRLAGQCAACSLLAVREMSRRG